MSNEEPTKDPIEAAAAGSGEASDVHEGPEEADERRARQRAERPRKGRAR